MDDRQFQFDVFISYSHTDSAWVCSWLLAQLEAAGLRICIDERDFDLGVPSIVNMERAVEQSRHTLLVLTPAWVASEWTRFEALLTRTEDPAGLRQRLLPLLLLPCQPPRHIGILTYADFTDPQQHVAQFQRVVETIQGRQHLADLGPSLQTLDRPSSQPHGRNRDVMIAKVRLTWIAGVLDQSVANEARIALGLEARHDAVINPIDLVFQRPGRIAQQLPPGSQIGDIYDQMGGALLILGAPGAGKTTLLLELTRDLLDRAHDDPQYLIPVVFPLSTWAVQRRPLVAWLVNELAQLYQVPRAIAQHWIDSDAILPLLDGLDEVAEPHRNACVDAINAYRQTRGHLPLVVSSRIADYEALTTRLRLHGAIVAQPLSRDQVRTYVRAVGVAAIPSSTSPLWELLDTPLMLTVAALAYAGQPLATLPADPVAARGQLFAAYIDCMFARNNPQRPFTDAQTHHYLAYLAHQMQQHNQTTLYLENLQPDWLPLFQRRFVSLLSGIAWGLSVGLVYGISAGLIIGLILGLSLELFFEGHNGLFLGVVGGLFMGLILGPISGMVTRLFIRTPMVRNVNTLQWSWSAVWSSVQKGLLYGLGYTLVSTLIVGLCNVLRYGLIVGQVVGLANGLVMGLVGGLVLGLVGGVVSGLSATEINEQETPNQGIRRSGHHAVVSGLVGGLITGLVGGLNFGLISGLIGGLSFGLISGLIGGLSFGLYYGGLAYIQHRVIHLLLIRNDFLPRHLVPFLEYATQRIFLRRVGGGYIFIHRLLLEHFAAQYTPPHTTRP